MNVTLVYRLDVGSQNPNSTKLITRAENIDFNQGTLDYIGLDFVDSLTQTDAGKIKRTINLKTNDLGDSIWQNAEQLKYGTRNIFKQIFELRMPALVTAEEPVVS